MLGKKTLLTASNLNNAFISKTDVSAQTVNSNFTINGGQLTLKNSFITDNSSSSYLRIDPQGNKVIIYDGVNNQELDIYSSSGSESLQLSAINGTTSYGLIDVSSAIDHLEINTNSKKKTNFGGDVVIKSASLNEGISIEASGSAGQGGGRVFFKENGNGAYGFSIGFNGENTDGAILNWKANSFNISNHNNSVSGNVVLSIPRDSSTVNMYSTLNVTNKITASGGVGITGSNQLSFDSYGGGFNMTDTTWIRTTGSKSFYQNTGTMRTDGTLQVGNNGATLNVPNGGNFAYNTSVLFANTSGNVGVGTSSPTNKLHVSGADGLTGGIKLNAINLSTIGDKLIFPNIGELRLGNDNTWDYNKWAGIRYDSANLNLAIGGPASTYFQSNANPAKINLIFDGLGTTTINSDIVTINGTGTIGGTNINNSWLKIGSSLGLDPNEIYFSSVDGNIGAIGAYGLNFSTNGSQRLVIKSDGKIGINNTAPSYQLDVGGSIGVSGTVYSNVNNAMAFKVGDQSAIWDIDIDNTLGIYGAQNSAVGGIKLGSVGPTLYGSGGTLGINTTTPDATMALDVNGDIKIAGGKALYSGYNNNHIVRDFNNGNVTLSATGGDLYLGYQNTLKTRLMAKLVSSDTTKDIISTNGTLYYQGEDTDSRYVNRTGDIMTGALTILSGADVSLSGGGILQLGSGNELNMVLDGNEIQARSNGTASVLYLNLEGGTVTTGSDLEVRGLLKTSYGTAIRAFDEWLRINDDGSHTAGTYFGNTIVRTDGTLQVGGSGSYFNANSSGVTTGVDVSINKSVAKLNLVGTGSPGIELRSTDGGIPYIDFSNDSSIDYDARLILADDDSLQLRGANLKTDAGIQINGNYMGLFSGWNGALEINTSAHGMIFHGDSALGFGFHNNGNFYWAKNIFGSGTYVMSLDVNSQALFVGGGEVYRKGKTLTYGTGTPSGGDSGDVFIQI